MSIFDLIDKKIAIKCKTEKDARLVIDTAIANGLACSWNEGDDTGLDIYYEGCVCYMFERSQKRREYDMYCSGPDWAGVNGYELIVPENIDELGTVCEDIRSAGGDVFSLLL